MAPIVLLHTAKPLPPGSNLGAVESIGLVGELLGRWRGSLSNLMMVGFGERPFLSSLTPHSLGKPHGTEMPQQYWRKGKKRKGSLGRGN